MSDLKTPTSPPKQIKAPKSASKRSKTTKAVLQGIRDKAKLRAEADGQNTDSNN